MIERIAVIVMAFISMGFLFGCGGSKSALDGTWYEQASENADRIEISGGRLRYLYGFETPDPVAYSGRFTLKDDGSRKQIELDKNAEFYEELFYDPGQDIIVSEMFVLDYGTMSHEFRRTPYVAPPEPVYGERIDLSDPDAPKEIRWDDAALIEMSFYETVDYSHYMMSTVFLPKTGRYEYAVRTENGVRMIASNFCSAEIPLPEETWEELRELADRYHLSDLNGLNIRTEDVPETVDDYTVRITYGDGGSFFSTANWKDVPGDWFNFMKLANEYLYKAFIDAGWNQETGEYEPWIPMKRFGEGPENREAALTIPVEEDVRKKTDEASGEYTKVTVDHFVTDDLENENLAAALEIFPGVERRLQRVGDCAGAAVYDDYAHNPEKLAAMWRTLADAYPKGVAVLWRPHGYGPLRKMMDALAAMFAQMKRPQDELLLLPVYDAGGTANRSVNTDVLAARIAGARMVSDLNEAETVLRKLAPAVGAIVTAGARDPGLPVLARRLAEKE